MTLPGNLTTGTVAGDIRLIDGTVAAGAVVEFKPRVRRWLDAAADVILLAEPKTVTCDALGQFTVDLVGTDNAALNPTGWTWQVSIWRRAGDAHPWVFDIAVPSSTISNLADLAPVFASAGNAVTVGPVGPAGPTGPTGPTGPQNPLTGTGSPEGVVTAGVGSVYVDTAATLGAVQWVKASGAGNTGWRVVYGDTGIRALTTWTSGGVVTGETLSPASYGPGTALAGGIYVRRIANTIELYVLRLQRLSQTPVAVWDTFVLPTGFRPAQNVAGYVLTTSTTLQGYVLGSNGSLGRGGGSFSGASSGPVEMMTLHGQAAASPPWPVGSLPGS